MGADDLWEPVCTISGSSCRANLSERTKACFVKGSAGTVSTVLVPPSVEKGLLTGSSANITLRDRNVIVIEGSSNTVTAKSGTVIDLPKNMIPMMDRGSLVVKQDGEVFGGTLVFGSSYGNTINVLGKDSVVFIAGAYGTSVSGSLGSSAVGPGAFYNVGLMNHDRAEFTGEIWGPEGSSVHKRDFTLGAAGALVAQRLKDLSVAPEEGSPWAIAAGQLLHTEEQTAVNDFQDLLSATTYSEEGDRATANVDGNRYKGKFTVDWTVHTVEDTATSPPEKSGQPPVLDQADADGSTIAEQDGPSIELPLRQA